MATVDPEYCDHTVIIEHCYTKTTWKCPLKRDHEGEHNLCFEKEEAMPAGRMAQ